MEGHPRLSRRSHPQMTSSRGASKFVNYWNGDQIGES